MKSRSSTGAARSLVSCTNYRESISAQLDGEQPVVDERAIEAHLADCTDCAAWATTARGLVAPMRMMPAPAPQLTESILRAVSTTRARTPFAALVARCGLLAVGIIQAVLGMSVLVTGSGAMNAPEHIAHESGAFNLAIAVAFLTVVVRPRYAAAFLPMVGVLVGVLTVVCASDLISGQVMVSRVLTHLMMLAGLGLLATLTLVGRPRGRWHLRTRSLERVVTR